MQNIFNEETTFRDAALYWFEFGFQVIPVIPGTKKPAVKWDSWLENLSKETINAYWNEHPKNELAFIVGSGVVVFDTDSEEASKAMLSLMKKYNMYPLMVVKTECGSHYYFRLEAGAAIKMDSHSTTEHPERIDVKTGRGAVMLPPSKGKALVLLQAESTIELAPASQDFIDAIFTHNGRAAPSAAKPLIKAEPISGSNSSSLSGLKRLLDQTNPDLGYKDWLAAIMAINNETGGSDEGLELVDSWSSHGEKYKGRSDVENTWSSLSPGHKSPITIATLVEVAKDNLEPFERCKTTYVVPAVEQLIVDVKDDSAAALEPVAIDALAQIKKLDHAEYQRKRAKLKQVNPKVLLTLIDNAVKANNLDDEMPTTHHGYAKALLDKLTYKKWAPVTHNGSFHVVEAGTGLWKSKSIEILQRVVAETHDGQENCIRTQDYRAIASHAISLVDGVGFFDEAPIGIACPSGFYRIQSGEIKVEPLNPSHRQRYGIEVDPVNEGTPVFDEFLHETFESPNDGEEEQQCHLLQEVFGAAMLGQMPQFQKAVLFYDPYGRAGKGTVDQILRKLVPDKYVTAVSPFSWDSDYHVASLASSRFNVVGELPDDKPIPAAIFKSVLGGDLITGRHPTHRPFTFKNEAAHLFMSNHMINTRDHSEAFFARWLLLEFPNSLLRSGKLLDTGLADRIIQMEMPGIAFWAMEGARRLLNKGKFSESIVHDRLMGDWRRNRNSLEQFIHECCKLSPDSKIRRSSFYSAYVEWCGEVGRKPYAKSKVKDLLDHNVGHGVTHHRPNGIETFNGIEIVDGGFESLIG